MRKNNNQTRNNSDPDNMQIVIPNKGIVTTNDVNSFQSKS